MKILDRTIVCGFFGNLILWCLSLCGIIIVTDLLAHFDTFLSDTATVNPLESIASYYFYFCLRIIDLIVVFVILLSAVNILINMLRRNEVIALMALGVSPKRILFPFIVSVVICLIGVSYLRESFIPNHIIRICASSDFFTKKDTPIPVHPTRDEWTHLRIDGKAVSPDATRIIGPVFTMPGSRMSEPRVLRADEAVWKEAVPGRGEGYLVRGIADSADFFAEGAIDTAGNAELSNPASPVQEPVPADGSAPPAAGQGFTPRNVLVYAPGTAPGTAPDEAFVLCGIPPAFLAVGEAWKSYTSTSNLIGALRSMSFPYRKEDILSCIHQRVVKPFSDLFPLLLALPILFVYKDGNPYKRGIFAVLIAALFVGTGYFIAFACRSASHSSFFVFLPMIIFLPVVFSLFKALDCC